MSSIKNPADSDPHPDSATTMTETPGKAKKRAELTRLWFVQELTDYGVVNGIEYLRVSWVRPRKSTRSWYTIEPADDLRKDIKEDVNDYIAEWFEATGRTTADAYVVGNKFVRYSDTNADK